MGEKVMGETGSIQKQTLKHHIKEAEFTLTMMKAIKEQIFML